VDYTLTPVAGLGARLHAFGGERVVHDHEVARIGGARRPAAADSAEDSMPEMSLLVKALMVGFIALMVFAIVAYHIVVDAGRRAGGEAAASAEKAKARSA